MSFFSANKSGAELPNRKETKNADYSWQVSKLYDYKTVSDIDYLDNQTTLDNFFWFHLEFTGNNQQIKLILKDISDYSNPAIYMYAYDNNDIGNQTNAPFNINTLFDDYKRIKNIDWKNNQLWSSVDLSNLENWVYKITPTNIAGTKNAEIVLNWNIWDNKTIQFAFISNTVNSDWYYKWIQWKLLVENWEKIKITNIKRNETKIWNWQIIENYYQTDWINGINVYNWN